jgi:hypothetical protein
MIYPEEREAYISCDYFSQTYHVYTNNTTVIKRLFAKGYYPNDGRTLTAAEVDSLEYIEMYGSMDDLKNFANAGIFKAL